MSTTIDHATNLGAKPIGRQGPAAGLLASIFRSMANVVIWLAALTMLLPLLWMISTALKQPGTEFLLPLAWAPRPIVWSNFLLVWQAIPFGRLLLNSVLVCGGITFGQLLTCSLAAFAFARLSFPGRDRIFFAYLATLMVPSAVTLIPVFIIIHHLGWIDTYGALILPGIFSAYGTFLLRQYFLGIPDALEDAAHIDGCGPLRVYWNVVLPLSKPALITLGIFTLIATWRDFLWPLIVTNADDMRTLPVGLSVFRGMYSTEWTQLMAGSLMAMAPLVVVFILNQRFFVEGIKLTGVKG